MYYIGTEQQCLDYDKHVTENEQYAYEGDNWATPRKHPIDNIYCIARHPKYDSDMEFVELLSSDWVKTEEIE